MPSKNFAARRAVDNQGNRVKTLSYALQLNSSLPGIFWVKPQNIDGKGYLVSHALTWAMSAGEKLKVFKSVVLPIAVDMVNRFFGKQVSAKVLAHDVAMFKGVSRRFTVLSRNDNSDVAGLGNTLRNLLVRIIGLVSQSAECRSAFRATDSIVVPYQSTRGTGGYWLTTLEAGYIHAAVRSITPMFPHALLGAVKRVSLVLLDIATMVGRLHKEGPATVDACQGYGINLSGRPTGFGFPGSDAWHRTICLVGTAGFDTKGVATVGANLLNRHNETFHMGCGMASIADRSLNSKRDT